MGKALTVGAIDAGAVASTDVVAFDIFSTALDSLVAERGVSTADSIAGVATTVDVLLLAVKPHDVPGVLQQIRDSGSDTKSLLVISVAAGLPIARLEQEVGEGARVIRSMPNTPALIGKGAAAFTRGSSATEGDAASETWSHTPTAVAFSATR